MEPKASHILVGVFLLAALAALAGFLVWYSGAGSQAGQVLYQTSFRESVNGLNQGGEVRYRGIRIGEIDEIDINPDDPGLVDVTMKIGSRYRLRQGDRASLKLQGITGLVFVNIEGADAESRLLPVDPVIGMPRVPARESELARILEGAPALINQSTLLVEQVSELFGPRNQARFDRILQDIATLTRQLSESSGRFDRLFVSFETAGEEMASAAQSINRLAGQTGSLFERADSTLNRVDTLVDNLNVTTTTVTGMLDDDVRGLIRQARTVADSLDDLITQDLGESLRQLGAAARNVNQVVSGDIAPTLGQINTTALSLDTVVNRDLRDALNSFESAAVSVDELVDVRLNRLVDSLGESAVTDLNAAMNDIRAAAADVRSVTTEVSGLMDANSPVIADFASEGLVDFKRFIVEARQLVTSITRLVDRLEADGATFLLQQRQSRVQSELTCVLRSTHHPFAH